MITAYEASSIIDISAVRTHHCMKDIYELIECARKFRFVNVHVLPVWVPVLAPLIRDIEGVYVGAPVGFPSGAHKTITKILEAAQLLEDGVQEMDIVMNIGKLKNKEYIYVLQELKEIIQFTGKRAIIKVIIEINILSDEEMIRACDIVMDSGADFIKTGTGWIPGSANVDRIRKIKSHCGDRIKIKAAGGIRTVDEFLALYELGVERMGINLTDAVEIVKHFPVTPLPDTDSKSGLRRM